MRLQRNLQTIVAAIVFYVSNAAALCITVPSDFPDICDALQYAHRSGAVDTVFVNSGTYFRTESELVVPMHVVLVSTGGPTSTIIDGGNQFSGIRVDGQISGFTIRNCVNTLYSHYGAIFASPGSIIHDCIIHDCTASELVGNDPIGAAIQCEIGDITIDHCLVYNCTTNPETIGSTTGSINLYRSDPWPLYKVRITSSTILCSVSWFCDFWNTFLCGPFELSNNIPCFGSEIMSECHGVVSDFSEEYCCPDLQFDTEGTYQLSPNSSCIDIGDPDLPLDPDGTRADIGAYYYCQGEGIHIPDVLRTSAEPGYPEQLTAFFQTTCEPVVVDSAFTESSVFTLQSYPVQISEVYGTGTFSLTFHPAQQGLYADTLHIWANTELSNTDDPRHHMIPLVGEAGPIPNPISDLFIQILPDQSALLSWSPVTETIYGNPVTPDYYLIFYNELDPQVDEFWYYQGAVVTPGYTHFLVTRFRDLMSYRVVAWKGINPSLLGLVQGDPMQKLNDLR